MRKFLAIPALCLAVCLPAGSATVVTLTTAGTSNWVCPAHVFQVKVELWGGGGMGSSPATSNDATGHGGGGGGAYSASYVTVIPGNTYTIVVGAGGTNGSVNGNDSTFNSTLVVAKGGTGLGNDVTTGGAGGLASNGTGSTKYSGGSGAGYSGSCEPFGSGGGSSAGWSSNGTAGTNGCSSTTFTGYGGNAPAGGGNGGNGASVAPNQSGSPGLQPGGGGGGGMAFAAPPMFTWPVYGGLGAAGKCVLTYTPMSAVLLSE